MPPVDPRDHVAAPAGPEPGRGEMDVEDRGALRRVAGLGAAVELDEVTEVEYRRLRLERVVLVAVVDGPERVAAETVRELTALAETAGSEVAEALWQRRQAPDPATYVGSGKVRELRQAVLATGADTVIADGELTPGQLRTLEEELKVKVVDRTALILDIFAQHAQSKEGRAQVELAQLEYRLPRLRGWGRTLSRQAGGRLGGSGGGAGGGGGLGVRGPGETKLEVDRRRIRARIAKLRRDLKGLTTTRRTTRARRDAAAVPQVAVVGYTNAGKSSLMNALAGSDLLVQDALFATLDPTVRRTRLPDGRPVLLADTVGFVRRLPHQLVEAFRSTLEEAGGADLLLHVVDASLPDPAGQLAAVRTVLSEVGVADVPELVVVNKCDAAAPGVLHELRRLEPGAVVVSAHRGDGLDALREALSARLPDPEERVDVVVPWSRGDLLARVHDEGTVVEVEHRDDGTRLVARVDRVLAGALRAAAG